MAIKTSTFSGWYLSDEEAHAFLQQIEDSEPNVLADQAIEQGKELIDEYVKQGYVSISLGGSDKRTGKI